MSKKVNVTAIVITKNEEENIRDCVEGLLFCDQVIVVDDNSTDDTVAQAKAAGAKILIHKSKLDMAAQRNFALGNAKNDWVLFVDADERVSPELRSSLIHEMEKQNQEYSGFFVKRVDVLSEQKITHGVSLPHLRLAKKGSGLWVRRVHEVWTISGMKRTLPGDLLHYPAKSISAFVRKINGWSTQHALENMNEGKSSNIFKIIFWPSLKFLHNYYLRLGFLDNTQGIVALLMLSFHSYLAFSKQWILQKK